MQNNPYHTWILCIKTLEIANKSIKFLDLPENFLISCSEEKYTFKNFHKPTYTDMIIIHKYFYTSKTHKLADIDQ